MIISLINNLFHYTGINKTNIDEFIDSRIQELIKRFPRNIEQTLWSKINKEEFISIILKTNFVKYDTTIWYRH